MKTKVLGKGRKRGDISDKECLFQLAELRIVLAASALAIKVEHLTSKSPEQLFERLKKRGLIGNGSLITHTPEEASLEIIECEQVNRQITREECKNSSGSNSCDSFRCEQNEETRALLTNRLPGVTPKKVTN